MSPRLRIRILERDNYTCQYCGAQAPHVRLHVDHVLPRSRGGDDSPGNLLTACQACNLGKGAVRIRRPIPTLSGQQQRTLRALEAAHEVAFDDWMEQLAVDEALSDAQPDDPEEEVEPDYDDYEEEPLYGANP